MSYPDYKPLDATKSEIRLLEILPKRPEEPQLLTCSIKTVSLEDNPSYSALSYSRDDDGPREDILIDGHHVSVISTIASGVRACRDVVDGPMAWWVDGLCINHHDPAERTSQIGQISRIYSQAIGVVAWLGEAADESDRALSELEKLSIMLQDYYKDPLVLRVAEKLAKGRPKLGERVIRLASKVAETPTVGGWIDKMPEVTDARLGPIGTTADSLKKPNWSRITRRDIRLLMERPYWSCVWTFQELVLARDAVFVCGSKTLSWDHLATLVHYQARLVDEVDELWKLKMEEMSLAGQVAQLGTRFAGIDWMRNRYHLSEERIGLDTATRVIRNRKTKDPRDRVFAVLGLAQSDIKPDYSLPVDDIYRKVMAETLQSVGPGPTNADKQWYVCPLYQAGLAQHHQEGLASWAIDFTAVWVRDTMPLHAHAASGTEMRAAEAHVDERTLHMKGCYVGEIKRVWEVAGTNTPAQIPDIVKTWLADESLPCDRDDKVFDMLREVMTIGYGSEKQHTKSDPVEPGSAEDHILMRWFLSHVMSAFDSSLEGLPLSIKKLIEARILKLPAEYQNFIRDEEGINTRLQFFRVDLPTSFVCYTTDGRLVLASRAVLPGDMLYIVPGHPCPLVLRKCNEYFQIITISYVYGAMKGEKVGEDEQSWLASLQKLEIQ